MQSDNKNNDPFWTFADYVSWLYRQPDPAAMATAHGRFKAERYADEAGVGVCVSLFIPDRMEQPTNTRAAHPCWVDRPTRELLEVCNAILTRWDMEPKESIFPCSAMRETLRAAVNACK